MPYTASNVPDHVPKEKAEEWAARWNGAYESCQKRKGDDCEGYAFRVANAILSREEARAADDQGERDKLKKAQARRAKASGIAPKPGGALTRPAEYADCPDTNDTWGDWTNYAYPLVPKARAINAVTRFNNSANKTAGGYSDAEWAKIGRRIAAKNEGKVYRDGKVVPARALGGFRVLRTATGKPWWIGWSASAFLARDRMYIATEALERDVTRKAGQSRGPLLIAHVPGLKIGECLYGHVAGRILVEAGSFGDTPIAQEAARALEASDEPVAMSIRWSTPLEAFDADTFKDVDIIERSVLPAGREADQVTLLQVCREGDMDWKKLFAQKLGVPEAVAEAEIGKSEAEAEALSHELDGAGVPSREAPPETGRAEGETAPPAEAVLTKADLADLLAQAMQAIQAAVGAEIKQALEAQGGEIRALKDAGAQERAALEKRLAEIERLVKAPSEARSLLYDALTRRASAAPDTALDSSNAADQLLRKDTVGKPAHLFDKVRQ